MCDVILLRTLDIWLGFIFVLFLIMGFLCLILYMFQMHGTRSSHVAGLQNKKIQFISIYFEFIFCFEGVLLRGLMLPHVVVSLIMVNLYIFKTSKYRKCRRELMNQRISFVQTTAGLEMVYDY